MAKRSPIKPVLVVGILALVAGGAVAAYQAFTPDAPASGQRAATADIARAEVMTFDITTTATGELEARRSVELRCLLEQPSSIVEVVPEGTFVRAGTILVKLKSEDIRTQIEEETLRTESSRADLVAAENGYEIQVSQNATRLEQAQVKLRLGELSLQQWLEGDDKQMIQDLELALQRAQIDLERIDRLYDKKVLLEKDGFLSTDELQQEYIRLIAARAALSKAELALASYQTYERERNRTQKQSDVDQALAEVDRVRRQNEIELASRDASRINARRQFQIRESRLANLRTQLANCEIVAPTDGLVVYATSIDRGQRWGQSGQSPLQIGRQVMPNESLIVLPDTTEMLAKVRVHESLAGRVRARQNVDVKIDALPGVMFPGTVESIGVLAEGSDWRDPNRREYTVKISIQAPEGMELKPSMRADATITLGRVENALAVPIQAVFSEGMVRFVYVPRGSKFVRVPVQIGRRSELYAEATAGIEANTPVLIREPSPGEVLSEPWNEAQLKLVGLQLDDSGSPVPIGGMPMPGAGRTGGNGAPGGGQPPQGAPGMNNGTPGATPGASTGAEGGNRGDRRTRDGGSQPAGNANQEAARPEAAAPATTPATETAAAPATGEAPATAPSTTPAANAPSTTARPTGG